MIKSLNRRSTFEDLSDDILMDIFDLLNPPIYIYHSFYNINSRLNRILRDARLLISLDLSRMFHPANFAYHCQIMLPNMFKQLISLRLSNRIQLYAQIRIFLQHFHFSQFESLRQLALVQITFEELKTSLSDILSLKKLIHLEIDAFDGSGVSSDEVQLIANTLTSRSSSIKFLHLRFNREVVIHEGLSPSLRHLNLHACFSSDVPQLLSNCTNLRSLTMKVEQIPRRYSIYESLDLDETIQRQHLSSTFCHRLRKFSLDINDLTLTDVKSFLFHLPQLRYLSLQGLSYDVDFSKGDLWQKILDNQMKKLKEFHIPTLRIWLGNRVETEAQLSEFIRQITSSFGPTHSFWAQRWSVQQNHELRPNHLNLSLHARAI